MRGVSVGIDLGTTAATTVVVRRDKTGAVHLVGVGRADAGGMRRGSVFDSEALARSLKKSVQEAERASDLKIKSAAVAFSGSGVNSSLTKGVIAISRADGEITREDIDRVMRAAETFVPKNANREIVHLIPREFRIDSESGIKDPIGMVGMRLEVEALVIDGQKAALNNIVKAFDLSGIEIKNLLFAPYAASQVMLTPYQKELGVMLLDVGAGTSDYAIFQEGNLIDAGVVPIGGEHITHDITIGFQTRIDVADIIKRKYGHILPDAKAGRSLIQMAEFVEDDTACFQQRELAEIIQARAADIFELVSHVLHDSRRPFLLPCGVILTGGTSVLPGIKDFARRELQLPVERGTEVYNIELDGSFGSGLELGPAIGVSVWQLSQSDSLAHSLPDSVYKVVSRIKNWLRVFMP